MKQKECKIQIPEGYEIDKENSTFERIVFKPIESLTYNDVCKSLFKGNTRYYLTDTGDTESVAGGVYRKNESSDCHQLKKILAINQLMNIAKYYNGDWTPDWNNNGELKYYIYHNKSITKYGADIYRNWNVGVALFKNKKDAQAVINNPNFRNILDTIFKS